MSNPDNAAAQSSEHNSETAPNTFEAQVNDAVSKMTQNEKGLWQLPADLEVDESVKYAAKLEKRRRDTESALSKTRQELKAEGTMRKTLEQRVAEQVKVEMTPEQQETLDALKYDDPDAWRVEMNKLEQTATTTLRQELDGLTSEASQQAEMERRAQVLEEFNAKASVPITDEVLENDIPPRFVKQLENGEVTFEEFLTKAQKFLTSGKVVKDTKLDAQPNLGSAGGGSDPAAEAVEGDFHQSYRNEVY